MEIETIISATLKRVERRNFNKRYASTENDVHTLTYTIRDW